MKFSNTSLLLIALLCLIIPASAVDTVSASYSIGAGTPDDPPRDAIAYIRDAQAAVAVRDWPGVLTITTRGLAWYPDNTDLLCFHGYTLRKLGQYDRAVDTVSQAIRLEPNHVRYTNRGYGYLALDNFSAALADAEAGIALDPGYPSAWSVKALALLGTGNDSAAHVAIDRAIALDNGSAHSWHVKGRILAAQGDCTGASVAFGKSIGFDSAYPVPWPGFGSASEDLAALNTTCTPAPAIPGPAKSPLGLSVIAAALSAAVVFGMRK